MRSFDTLRKFLVARNFAHMSETSWQQMMNHLDACDKDIQVMKNKILNLERRRDLKRKTL